MFSLMAFYQSYPKIRNCSQKLFTDLVNKDSCLLAILCVLGWPDYVEL